MSNTIPIYWVSYTDEGDHERPSRLKKKIGRLEKAINNKNVIIRISSVDQNEGHIKTLQTALQNKEKQIIILEDQTSITDINAFGNLTHQYFESNEKIIHFGGYLEDKIYDNSNVISSNFVKGHIRSLFGYWVNLENDIEWLNNGIKMVESRKRVWSDIVYQYSSSVHSPFLVVPFGYSKDDNLMNLTLKGLSCTQFTETGNDLSLNFKSIGDDDLPRITILTVLNNHRLWWPLIRLNLDNMNYPSKKMKWIIVDVENSRNYTIEDLLPRKRGTPGGWELEYIKLETDNTIEFTSVVNDLEKEGKLVGDFVVEFDPQSYYPSFSVLSRIKTMLKYPLMKSAGSVEIQLYDIINDTHNCLGTIDDCDFKKGSRVVRRGYDDDLKTKIRIPSQFVTYYLNVDNKMNGINFYNGNDKFPDFLESEDFFPDMVMIIDNLKKKILNIKH
jgi:hypothetical protein